MSVSVLHKKLILNINLNTGCTTDEKVGEKDVNLLKQNVEKNSVSESLSDSTILKHLLMCPCSYVGS